MLYKKIAGILGVWGVCFFLFVMVLRYSSPETRNFAVWIPANGMIFVGQDDAPDYMVGALAKAPIENFEDFKEIFKTGEPAEKAPMVFFSRSRSIEGFYIKYFFEKNKILFSTEYREKSFRTGPWKEVGEIKVDAATNQVQVEYKRGFHTKVSLFVFGTLAVVGILVILV